MTSLAPEFAQYWLAGPATVVARYTSTEQRDDELAREKAALEALAERVTAARSIV
jgi:hypothetical protein